MSDQVKIELLKREIFGKKVKNLRKEGLIPAVLHNHGKESLHVAVNNAEMAKAYAIAGKSQAVDLKLDGKEHVAIIRDIDYEPARTDMRHVVFQLIRANEKIETTVPVEIVGEIPAVKAGFQVNEIVKEIEIKALPKDLVEHIEVSGESLVDVGDSITVGDIKAPAGIEIITELEQVIANVEAVTDQVAEADAALEEMAEADGKVAEETSEDETASEEPAKE